MMQEESKEALLKQRYGATAVPENILWNPQIEALLKHRSVRTFLPDALPDGAIETMVAAAQSASNSSNLNQWSVVAITDPALKARFAEVSRKGSKFGMGNPFIEEAPVLLLWVADMYRNSEIAAKEGKGTEVLKYTDAVLMASIDTSLAAQNAVVAAESMGLGVVFLGIMRNNAKEIADLLNLPNYAYVVFGMAVGKPDMDRRSSMRPRLSQKAVLHYNSYDRDAWKGEIEDYETAFKAFRDRNNMKPKTWKEAVLFATSDMDFMDGRENLRTTLEEREMKLL